MVSTGVIIGIVVAIIVIIIILVVILLLASRRSGNTGTTGITGATGCATQCTTNPMGCSAPNTLAVSFSGTNCPGSCKTGTNTLTLSGCVVPQCGSPTCNFQQALYMNLNPATGSLFNICSSGATGSGLIANPCPNPITGTFLASLNVQGSSISNNKINPIFITTIFGSIYGTSQPAAPTGIDPVSIMINPTDSTVIDDPWLLYQGPTNILSFQRLSVINKNLDITNSIFVYNTDGGGSLILLKLLGAALALDVTVLSNISSGGDYTGPNPVCGLLSQLSTQIGHPVVVDLTYNPNTGYFLAGEASTNTGINYTNLTVINQPDNSIIPPSGRLATGFQLSTVNYGGPCNYFDVTRWISISAISINL